MNRTTFNRNFGFTPDRLRQMKENAESKESVVTDKLWWFKQPEGVENFVPTECGFYNFDVLQFPLKYSYHPYFAKQKIYDLGGLPWFEREVIVHSIGNNATVCKKTFQTTYNMETRCFEEDPVCSFNFAEENRSKEFYKKINKKYSVFVIRLHPGSPLGNTEYKIMTFIASRGIFGSKLYEEFEVCQNINDPAAAFYRWDDAGKSVRARFSKLRKKIGDKEVEWIGCDKIDFFDRPIPISDKECDIIMNINIDDCIATCDENKCNAIVEYLKKGSTTASASTNEVEEDDPFEAPAAEFREKLKESNQNAMSETVDFEEKPAESSVLDNDEW